MEEQGQAHQSVTFVLVLLMVAPYWPARVPPLKYFFTNLSKTILQPRALERFYSQLMLT